jgi:hypothetical protein
MEAAIMNVHTVIVVPSAVALMVIDFCLIRRPVKI